MAKKNKKSTKDQMEKLVGVAVSVNPIMEKDGEKDKRKKYQEGNEVSDIITDEEKEYYKNLKKEDQSGMTFASLALISKQINDYLKGMEDGIISEKDGEKQIAILRETEKKLIAENQREQKQEGGEMDSQMTAMMMPTEETEEIDMLPDDQMEDQHLDFIINESLDNEEEMYLMEQLQADERLSMIFDKIMDTATEFSGSGPVEGLGTEVSDSIPARLSDGEFVMTAKATDEIGADNLERMMKDAEEASDNRQRVAMGGEIEKKVDRFGKPIDEDLTAEEIKRSMLSVNPRLR